MVLKVKNGYIFRLVETAEDNYLDNIVVQLSSNANFKEQVLSKNSPRMLDIGCYTGKVSKRISEGLGIRNVYGLEIDDEAIVCAENIGVKVIKEDLSADVWNIEDNSFEFIFCNQVIEHLWNVNNLMVQIKRILTPDGMALIVTENLAAWHNIFSLLFGWQPFSMTNISTICWSIGNPMSISTEGHDSIFMIHRAIFTYRALEELILLCGFQIIQPICAGYYPFPNGKIGNVLANPDKRHSVSIAFLIKKS